MISSGSRTDGCWYAVAEAGDDGCDVGAVGWAAAGTGARAGSSERAGSDADTGVVSGREGEEDGGRDGGGEDICIYIYTYIYIHI